MGVGLYPTGSGGHRLIFPIDGDYRFSVADFNAVVPKPLVLLQGQRSFVCFTGEQQRELPAGVAKPCRARRSPVSIQCFLSFRSNPYFSTKQKKPEHLFPRGNRWSGANANNNDLMVRPDPWPGRSSLPIAKRSSCQFFEPLKIIRLAFFRVAITFTNT